MKLDKLLEKFSSEKASDLHLSVGSPPMLRTLKGLRFLGSVALKKEDAEKIADRIIPAQHKEKLESTGACQFSYEHASSIFRVSVYKSRRNVSLAIRQIPNTLPTLDDMEVPTPVKNFIMKSKGIILVSGPAGSGKTSTLHGMVDHLNRNAEKHIITIEDPIEYFHENEKSMVNQREVGVDVPSAEEGVRQAMQQDPDVLVIGEIKSYSMADAALSAAEAGHLVLGTMHTGATVHTINAILDSAPPNLRDQTRHRLASSLVAILSQVLLPPKKGAGSVPAYELMIMTSAISSLVRKNKIGRIINVMQSEKSAGMTLLDDWLYDLYMKGRVTKEDMLAHAIETVEIETRLQVLKAREEEKRVFQE